MKTQQKTLLSFMITWLLIAFVAYLLICAGMYALQRKLMYFPHTAIEAPSAYGLQRVQEETLKSRDGVELHTWYQAAAPGFPIVIYFHGNAGNHAFRAAKFAAFTETGLGLLAIQYRGYGRSTGVPSESGIYDDARAALEYAKNTLRLEPSQIVLFGESLGTGVAVQMATEYPVGAVALEAPYTSVEGRAAELYSYLPVRLLLRDKFYSDQKIKSVHTPLLILHGELDQVIPFAHGQSKLFGLANEPKSMVAYPGIGHVDFDLARLAADLITFLKAQKLISH